ncbi:MAG: ParB N-terminal domain-containing protein [Acidobacteriaceae bacterium]
MLELHPLCTLFPRMEGDSFAELVADIRANGLREPITLHNGMILDGGNRYRACLSADVKPMFREFKGDDIAAFVLSANLHRRHLSAGQSASIIAGVSAFAKQHPPHRIAATAQEGYNIVPLSTEAARAKAAGVHPNTQHAADKVQRADPELSRKVAAGEVTLAKALEKITGTKRTKKHAVHSADEAQSDLGAPVETDADVLQNLRAELAQAHALIAELHDQLESYQTATSTEHAVAKELNVLKGKIRTISIARDGYMTTVGELRKEVALLRRQLGKK